MSVHLPGTRWYNAVWRWHFYAGLLCVPFVLWLALTGSIYLWKPQIEAWLDRPYHHLVLSVPAASADAQVAAALAAVPGGRLHHYVLPPTPNSAVDILVTQADADKRVSLNPSTLQVLRVVSEEKRPMRVIFHLHGELLAGAWGSYLVETAACWTIVMLLTGLYLWWPRGTHGFGGILYPRLSRGRRLIWRDLHAVAGFWVTFAALGLILTGLPWAQGWGSYLGEVRALTGSNSGPADWSIGGTQPNEEAMAGMARGPAVRPARIEAGDLARVIKSVHPLVIAPPVLITPPGRDGGPWTVASDADNRPRRLTVKVDGVSGHIISRSNFSQKHWIDRAIGYGIAVHEGAFFGLANQLLGTLTALLLIVLSLSGAWQWWLRRPIGVLGAPIPLSRPRFGAALVMTIIALGVYMPVFGATLLFVLCVEYTVLRRVARARHWLGLRTVA